MVNNPGPAVIDSKKDVVKKKIEHAAKRKIRVENLRVLMWYPATEFAALLLSCTIRASVAGSTTFLMARLELPPHLLPYLAPVFYPRSPTLSLPY